MLICSAQYIGSAIIDGKSESSVSNHMACWLKITNVTKQSSLPPTSNYTYTRKTQQTPVSSVIALTMQIN